MTSIDGGRDHRARAMGAVMDGATSKEAKLPAKRTKSPPSPLGWVTRRMTCQFLSSEGQELPPTQRPGGVKFVVVNQDDYLSAHTVMPH
jgi:hypothetical protein